MFELFLITSNVIKITHLNMKLIVSKVLNEVFYFGFFRVNRIFTK
jgi:hypothetical protein